MSLKQKIERAFIDVVKNSAEPVVPLPVNFAYFSGQENNKTPRTLPCMTVDATGGKEEPLHTGNFKYRVLVGVFGSADMEETEDNPTAQELHSINVEAVQRALNLHPKDLAALLSTGTFDFHCFWVNREGQVPHEPDHRAFADFFAYEVTCCENTFV